MIAVLAMAVGATALGGYAAASNGANTEASALDRLATVAPGPHRFARAYKLDSAVATPVFTLATGASVSVAANADAKCLLRVEQDQTGEDCMPVAAIESGRAVWVFDECGDSGRNRMEIIGLAPDRVASVRLVFSDGSEEDTAVTDGAFRFDGENPKPGAAYPTKVRWIGTGGQERGTGGLPVEGAEFCIPAPG